MPVKQPRIGGIKPFQTRDFAFDSAKKVHETSWIERLGRPALGTCECTECGRVMFHYMPGAQPDGIVKGGFRNRINEVGNSALTSHKCDKCGARASCGYSCNDKPEISDISRKMAGFANPIQAWERRKPKL